MFLFVFYSSLLKVIKFEPTKYQREKIFDRQNTHEKKNFNPRNTHNKKKFGPMKYPREKILDSRWHDGMRSTRPTMSRAPKNLAYS